jgi:hypothetical protein
MITNEWITDRRPTEADTIGDGYVRMCVSPGSEDWTLVHWSYVGAGIPWRHPADWQPKPALAVGQRWRRRDRKVVTIDKFDRGHAYGQTHPFWAGESSYTLDGRVQISVNSHPWDLVELLPSSPLDEVVKQLKELRDRIQPILDLHDSLPPN